MVLVVGRSAGDYRLKRSDCKRPLSGKLDQLDVGSPADTDRDVRA